MPGNNGDTIKENILMDMQGREDGECGMYGDGNMETYMTICKIDSQWEFAVCFREHKLRLCNNLERWDEEGGGREVQEGWNVYIPMAKLMLMLGRNQHNSIKQLSFN